MRWKLFSERALLTSHTAKAVARKATRATHGPRVLALERMKKGEGTENVKEIPKVQTGVNIEHWFIWFGKPEIRDKFRNS